MAVVTPVSGVPLTIEAGNFVSFTETLTAYPASLWTMAFVLSSGSLAPISTAATANGDDFLVTLSGTVTNSLAQGRWEWAEYVTASTERTTARNGVLTVLPNLATQATPSAAQAMLTALETAITSLASSKFQSVNFNGQSYSRRDMKSLLDQRVLLQAEVIREQNRLAVARGARDPYRIGIEFVPQDNGEGLRFGQGWPYRPY